MKKKLLPLAALFVSGMVYSQVGVGTHYPNQSSQMEITSKDKGVLIPRIALKSTTDATTITNGNVESLLVYNTTSNTEVEPGYYYWFRNKWTRIISDDDTSLFLNTNNVKLSVINGELVLEDSEGDVVSVLLTDLAKPDVITTLVDNKDGSYTYTNEAGAEVTINVVSDVTNNFQEIINTTEVQNILNEYLTKVEGNVTFDGDNFIYHDENGVEKIIDISEMVKLVETETTIVQDTTTRIYTYTNERGNQVEINVIADVTNKFEEIINNTLVQNILNEYLTKVEGNVTFDGDNFIYHDENGVEKIIDISELVKLSETVTTIVQDATTKVYTYTNEKGNTVDINVIADVTNKFEEIINNTDVQNILNEYLTKVEGNVTFDGDNFIYYDENGVEQTINITNMVRDAETLTNLVKVADGKYVYYNEASYDANGDLLPGATGVTIDVITDVTNNFEEIINEETIKNIFNEYISKIEGNVTFDGDNFIYYDENGVEQTINITNMVRDAETLTNLVKVADGKYVYYNEASYDANGDLLPGATGVTIDVITDVTNNFEEIINEETIKNIFNEYISKLEGNVTYDGDNFIYYDENGVEQTINITNMVRDAETLTNLVKLDEGKYVYYNEASYDANGALLPGATGVTIDVITDITNNFEEILNEETIKNIFNEYISKIEGNVTYDGDNFIYYDENGVEQTINITNMVRDAETLTNLVKLDEGKYVYYNEASYDANGALLPGATGVTIDVITDITNNFEEILNEETIKNIFNEYISKIEGNVTYDGDNFIYYDENGVEQTINITNMVRDAETLTNLVKLDEGKYVYYNEASYDANGALLPGATGVTIDVITDVTNNFEEIINEETIKNIFNEYISKLEGNVTYDGNNFIYYDENGVEQIINIEDMVKLAETETTIVQDATTKVYTYTNEKGNTVDINVLADVTNNFEEIINNTDVQNILNEYLTKVEGNVTYDGDNFVYYDENGVEQIINIEDMVKLAETETTIVQDATTKIYTYTNEKGNTVDINVIADVTNNFEEIINNTDVQNILNEYLTQVEGNVTFDGNNFVYYDENGVEQIIDITSMVKAAETETTIIKEDSTKVYVYTNEKGKEYVIDVVADITNKFEEIINNTDVQNILNEYFTKVEGNVTYDGDNFVYYDENGVEQIIDITELVKAAETETTLVDNADGTYTYTNEKATPVVIDIPASIVNNTNQDFLDYITNLIEEKQTLTSLVDVVTPGFDENNQEIDIHTLTYTDEKGVANEIDLKVLVKGTETLTTMTYDPTTHSLTYTDEQNIPTTFNLVDMVGDVQTLTTLELDIDAKKLVYTDENKAVHTLDLAPIIQEPWYSTTTNQGAIANTDNIYTKGWVGIGYTTPSDVADEKLRVNGSISTVNSSYADYVFEDYFDGFSEIKLDYKFKDLNTVEDFIKTNRHLPGITPIHELAKTDAGYAFNLSELSIQLLEKTEELYLHVIDQKNQIELKDAKIQKLEEANKAVQDRLTRLEGLLLNK